MSLYLDDIKEHHHMIVEIRNQFIIFSQSESIIKSVELQPDLY